MRVGKQQEMQFVERDVVGNDVTSCAQRKVGGGMLRVGTVHVHQ